MSNIYVNSTNKRNIAYLIFERKKIRCLVGKNGIGKKNREGDHKTPKGIFRINQIYYRKDKFLNLKSGIPVFKIEKNDKWCVDPKSKRYNSFFRKNINCSYESLFRGDEVYDLILVLNYNLDKIKKFKGSAIFLHCIGENKFTEGCVSIEKNYLKKIIHKLSPLSKVIIS
tara:strand:+ start:179 stop:688 length:510 start_codon:yes stop_codon:yes gene_type:complete